MYSFDPKTATENLLNGWAEWAKTVGATKFVLGISGGKDSTFLAKAGAMKFGPENIYGVTMPNGVQPDINDSMQVIKETGINHIRINIAEAFSSIAMQVKGFSTDARTNLPPRLRMASLFAVAQTVGGMVLCTDNLSEFCLGYCTMFGDGVGCYDPIKDYTATEVVKMGEYLGISDNLIHKKPGDGLQALGDEDRFGFTYAELDAFIREGTGTDELKQKVMARVNANAFKREIVNVPYPASGLPNFILRK